MGRHLFERFAAAWLLALAGGCASLPSLDPREPSAALRDTGGTRLGRAIAPLAAAHPGRSAFHPLADAHDAFAARRVLAGAAERSLDVQYYIWHGDQVGLLMFEALTSAARRGVRVRLLLDDQNTKAIEGLIPALAAYPNMELRLYNPFATRGGGRFLGYLTDFDRLNRRMHNKAFIADNQAAIVGGRNIGNEYFAAGTEIPFQDLDVLALGPAVRDVSSEFDLYWASASAYPASRVSGHGDAHAIGALDARLAAAAADPAAREYLDAVRRAPLLADLLAGRLALAWAEARLVSDDPAKTLDREGRHDVLMLAELLGGGDRPRASLDMVSPYFVPGEKGADFLEQLAASGVRVRVLTNSLSTTEAAVVHSGYAKRRCRLARAGVKLYEYKPMVTASKPGKPGLGKSSGARLHAKTYAADGKRLFVGSFNFDPRSALLNTEMGLVIASPELAGRLVATFEERVPLEAYEVRPRADGACVEWVERTPAGETIHQTEPNTGPGTRAWLELLMLMPIDWLL